MKTARKVRNVIELRKGREERAAIEEGEEGEGGK